MGEKPKVEFANIQDFQLDDDVMREGVRLDLGNDRWLQLARAGTGNRKYEVAMAELYDPTTSAIEDGTLKNEDAANLFHQVYARSVVTAWGGFANPKGLAIPFTEVNVVALFESSPEIFRLVRQRAEKFSTFSRRLAEDSGNESPGT